MAGVEIREYAGDFEDVVALAWRVWIGEYGGRIWAPLPETAFMRERFAPETGAIGVVALQGNRLVGSVFSLPRTIRLGRDAHRVALCAGLTVDPAHARVALPLNERLRRLNEERGAAACLGMVLTNPDSASYRFWMKYAETYPSTFRIVAKSGFWAKFLRPDAMARAGIERWERLASRLAGPLLRRTPFGPDAHVRSYVATDLDRCLEMSERTSAGVDWATRWTAAELAAQLGGASYTTLVHERDGIVRAFVNYHTFPMHGRELVRCAMLHHWAEDGMTAPARIRFVSHVCTGLRDAGVDMVIAPRSATMPAAALLANLFLPASEGFHIGLFPTRGTQAVPPPKSWSFDLT